MPLIVAGNPDVRQGAGPQLREGQLPGLRIRRADLAADKEQIVAVLGKNVAGPLLADRYNWLFLANPAGEELVWIAEDVATGAAIGVAAGYPRRMRVDGDEVMALNLGYFAFDAPYRSLGPGLELLRASLEPVREGQFAFAYDHPSESMLAIYRRMGGVEVGRMQRWVRLVTCRDLVARQCGESGLSRLLAATGDVALRARDGVRPVPRGIAVDLLEGSFTEEFDGLDQRLRGACRIEGVRSAAYLNWRYAQSMIWEHDVLCARQRGELSGYLVLRVDHGGRTLTLVEMAPVRDLGVQRALLVQALARARMRGAVAVVTHGLADSAVTSVFRELGFFRRQIGTSVCSYASAEGPYRGLVARGDSWWMIEGDRDV